MSANWRLENAKKRPAAMLQQNNPDATRISIPRMYICTWYLVVAMHVCQAMGTRESAPNPSLAFDQNKLLIVTGTGCVRWMSMGGKNTHKQAAAVEHFTVILQQAAAVEQVTPKRRLLQRYLKEKKQTYY